MIDFKTETHFTPEAVQIAAEKGNFNSLGHAAASISKDAKQSVKRAAQDKPSRPGTPPHTHRRVFYRRAIRFDVDKQKQEAVIGFMHSIIGTTGATHEFGLTIDGTNFPERPTIGPALDRQAARLGNNWRGYFY